MAEFVRQELNGSRFERVDLVGSRFWMVDLSQSDLREVDLHGVRMRGVELVDVDIDGALDNVTINGVDIGPLVEAALDQRYPERAKMRPSDPDGFREAWEILRRLWDDTVERARRLDPGLLHESVDEEWSFIQTLRHLVFATDSWIGRALLGDATPWHPLGLPWDGMPDTPGVPRDYDARPSLDEMLELRRDRMATVREVLTHLTESSLQEHTEPVEAPGWPPPRSFPVRNCLQIVVNEEWEHRLFAERDLAVLASRG